MDGTCHRYTVHDVPKINEPINLLINQKKDKIKT